MMKNKKALILTFSGAAMAIFWLMLFATDTKYQNINYWWQICLSAITILGGIFGLVVSKHWDALKSGVGRSVIFISLGLISWGIAQAGWSYYNLKGLESPTSIWVSTIYIISIPLWLYGTLQLSRATGAKFGLRGALPKLLTILIALALSAFSYYILVVVDRGGLATFQRSFSDVFFDLGYAFGDVLLLAISLSIFGLSWRFLGGRFRIPIVLILASFVCLYVADFAFSYYDGKGQYYNGHWSDLLYLLALVGMGVGVTLLDPSNHKKRAVPLPPTEQPILARLETDPIVIEHVDAAKTTAETEAEEGAINAAK